MIVLSRKTTEAIRIADDIRIVVFRTGSGRVSLGIEAPRNIPVVREEIWKRSGRSLDADIQQVPYDSKADGLLAQLNSALTEVTL